MLIKALFGCSLADKLVLQTCCAITGAMIGWIGLLRIAASMAPITTAQKIIGWDSSQQLQGEVAVLASCH
jgi:hypothetical protein